MGGAAGQKENRKCSEGECQCNNDSVRWTKMICCGDLIKGAVKIGKRRL